MLSDEEIFKALGLRPVATLYITEPELERYRAIAREQERVTGWEMADMLSDWGNMTEKDFSAKYGFWSGWSETTGTAIRRSSRRHGGVRSAANGGIDLEGLAGVDEG